MKRKKGSGSFCIPRAAVEVLLDTTSMAKWLIPSYLKLAAHTDANGVNTTASHTSIRQTLRRNKDDAKKFVADLIDLGLLYSADDWTAKTGEVFPDDVPEKQKIRYVLNNFGEDRQDMVWFRKGLVDGVGEFTNPLRRLADCGSESARMFLYLHSQYDVDACYACNPNTTIYQKYVPKGSQWGTNYLIKEWSPEGGILAGAVMGNVFPEIEALESHVESVSNLEAAGFIYETVAVVSTPIKVTNPQIHTGFDDDGESIQRMWDYKDMEQMAVVYELSNQDRFTTDPFQESIRKTVKQLTDSVQSGHIYSILPTGLNHSVMGLYKPRFVPDNEKNAFVAASIKNREDDKAQAEQWLAHFIKTKGLTRLKAGGNKSEENKITSCPFDLFWKAYPRKEKKSLAKKSFLSKIKTDEIPEVMEKLEAFKRSEAWTKDDGRYIPHAMTWINQRRWEDDLDTTVPAKPKYRSLREIAAEEDARWS